MTFTHRTRQIVAALVFVASIALNARTLFTALRPHPIAPPLTATALTDPAEIAAAENDLIGAYITGERAGDRMITIEAGGRIRFFELGATGANPGESASYRVARSGKQLYLVLDESGFIAVTGLDSLDYFGDRYTRTASPPHPSEPLAPPTAQRRAPRVASRGAHAPHDTPGKS